MNYSFNNQPHWNFGGHVYGVVVTSGGPIFHITFLKVWQGAIFDTKYFQHHSDPFILFFMSWSFETIQDYFGAHTQILVVYFLVSKKLIKSS